MRSDDQIGIYEDHLELSGRITLWQTHNPNREKIVFPRIFYYKPNLFVVFIFLLLTPTAMIFMDMLFYFEIISLLQICFMVLILISLYIYFLSLNIAISFISRIKILSLSKNGIIDFRCLKNMICWIDVDSATPVLGRYSHLIALKIKLKIKPQKKFSLFSPHVLFFPLSQNPNTIIISLFMLDYDSQQLGRAICALIEDAGGTIKAPVTSIGLPAINTAQAG